MSDERPPRPEQQGDGQPENQRELEDPSGGAALAGGEHGDTASTTQSAPPPARPAPERPAR